MPKLLLFVALGGLLLLFFLEDFRASATSPNDLYYCPDFDCKGNKSRAMDELYLRSYGVNS
jgi:hypothetical protein